MIKENNKKKDKKIIKKEKNTITSRFQIFLLSIKLILGTLLAISSVFILIILYKDDIIEQKYISFIVEPIIFIISIIGILPYKGKSCKKLLYLYIYGKDYFFFHLVFILFL